MKKKIMMVILAGITGIGFSTFAGLPPEEVNSSWTNNWGERAMWSRAKLRRNTTGYFDCFDLPDAKKITAGSYPLERIDQPGQWIDPATDFANKAVMMVFVNPSNSKGWRDARLAQALKDYQAMYDEFNPKGVEFITVYSDVPKNKKNMEARRRKAEEFFEKNSFPGILAVEDAGNGIRTYCKLQSSQMYDSAACVFKDENNTIIFRELARILFNDAGSLVLRRITDPDFNEAIYNEFPNQTRTLPVVEKQKNALVYRDDFESYGDRITLQTAPRWGFHYETQYRVDAKATLQKGVGVDHSQAAEVDSDYPHGLKEGGLSSVWHPALEHDFPAPLTDGSFRFKLKNVHQLTANIDIRNEYDRYNSMLATDLLIVFNGAERVAPAGYLIVKNGTFILLDENVHIRDVMEKGTMPLQDKQWHDIEMRTVQGGNSELFINGTRFGTLTSGRIVGMNIRCRPGASFLVDDVELRYNGDPEKLVVKHADYRNHVQLVQVGETPYPFTDEEKKSFSYRFKVSGDRKQMFFHNLTPLNGHLRMEKVHKPGEYVDILEDRGGKPLYIHMSQPLSPQKVLYRTHTGSAKALPVRQMTHALKDELEIYTFSGQYWAACLMGYEENRLLRCEQAIAKNAARKILGRAHFWEVDEACDEDHNLLAYDFDDRWNQWTGVDAADSLWGGTHGSIPFHISGFYLNADGKMTADSAGEYNYHEGQWPIMRATIDPELAESMVNDFKPGSPIVRQVTLPDVETTAGGTYYRDNFDSYTNNTELLTQPCWGFNYEWMNTRRSLGYRRYFMHRATIDPGEGIDGSNAMFVDCSHRLDRVAATPQAGREAEDRNRKDPQIGATKHIFPNALTQGHFKCSVRQSLKSQKQSYGGRGVNPKFTGRWFWLELLDENGDVIDSITTTGQPMNQTQDSKTSLCLDVNKQGEVSIAEEWKRDNLNAAYPQLKKWHEINVVAIPGSPVEVFVNGQSIGTLSANEIHGIKTYARDGDGMYMDDVELFYAK